MAKPETGHVRGGSLVAMARKRREGQDRPERAQIIGVPSLEWPLERQKHPENAPRRFFHQSVLTKESHRVRIRHNS